MMTILETCTLIFLFKQVKIDIYVIYNVVGLLYSYYSERNNSRFLVPLIQVSNSKSKHRTVNIRWKISKIRDDQILAILFHISTSSGETHFGLQARLSALFIE